MAIPLSRSVLVVVVFAGAVAAAAQTPPSAPSVPPQSDTATLRVTTRLVVLDVVVLDKAGHPVSNLDRSQFTVTENKVPQKLRGFDPPAGHALSNSAQGQMLVRNSADLGKIGNAPVNILVFDELNTPWEGAAYAREQMEKYLKAQPEVLTAPTLMLSAGDSRFAVLRDYTQSRAELLESAREYRPRFPFHLGKAGSGNANIELLEQTLGALSQIAESSRGTPGRKNVIWVGSGYPSLDTTTLEPEDEDKLMAVIRRVTDRMLSARVTLYMVDPMGVQTAVQSTGTGGGDDGAVVESGITSNLGPYAGTLDFATFASATGGEVFANRNDINVAIAQGAQEGSVYYTLSYSPTEAGDQAQAYRQIKVHLNDRSLRVFTRDGYFAGAEPIEHITAPTDKPSNQLQFDIMSAARTRLTYNALKVDATTVENGYVLLVGAKDLHFTEAPDGSRIAEVTVMTVFFNGKDKELRSSATELKERVAGQGEFKANAKLALKLPLEQPSGTARVRFVVRDAVTGNLGTADVRP